MAGASTVPQVTSKIPFICSATGECCEMGMLMLNDPNEYVAAEAVTQYPTFDSSDDELERAASDQRQAISWDYCTQWWVCPM